MLHIYYIYVIDFGPFVTCSTILNFLSSVGVQVGEVAFKADALLTLLIFSVSTNFENHRKTILSQPSALRLFPRRDSEFYHEIIDF
jgi:hypothetical protein